VKIAGAPISWGVCEVPGWGYQLPADRVLAEMRELGLTATEYGPDGYLTLQQIRTAGLEPAGGFVPVVLHDPATDVDEVLKKAHTEGVVVLAAATGTDGYDQRPELDAAGWAILCDNLSKAADTGRSVVLHPHVGTMIERPDEVRRVLGNTPVPLCLDTGHLLIGGTDPAALAREYPDRVGHVHLKDVDAALADRVRDGDLSYTDAVRTGLYRPLGAGDAGIKGVIAALHAYRGWYVLEQDTVLSSATEDPKQDVKTSLAYLTGAR
jgi:inosose dehydratase